MKTLLVLFLIFPVMLYAEESYTVTKYQDVR